MNKKQLKWERKEKFQFLGQNLMKFFSCSSIKQQFQIKKEQFNIEKCTQQYQFVEAFFEYYSRKSVQFQRLQHYVNARKTQIKENQKVSRKKLRTQQQQQMSQNQRQTLNNKNHIYNIAQITKSNITNMIQNYIQSADKILLNLKEKYIIKSLRQQKVQEIRQYYNQIDKQYSNNIIKPEPDFQKQLQNVKRKLQKCQFRLNQLNQQYNKMCSQNTKLKLEIQNSVSYDKYFHGNVFSDNEQSLLKWFVDSLEERVCQKIKKTKLLYRMDMYNKTNFHKYIDDIPHIIILIKLKNGNIIGGYSEDMFSQDNQSSSPSLGYLFSCKQEKIFSVKCQNHKNPQFKPKTVVWDEYYLIFGNSEIRIKLGQTILYSNFGIINSYYNNEGNSIDSLIGEGNKVRQAEIETYEIFEMKF